MRRSLRRSGCTVVTVRVYSEGGVWTVRMCMGVCVWACGGGMGGKGWEVRGGMQDDGGVLVWKDRRLRQA